MPKALARRLKEAGIEAAAEEEDEIVVRRELTASGRGKVTVNGVAGARQLLRDIAPYLADIHGQGESSTLLRADAGIDLLDRFGGTREARREVRDSFREVRRLVSAIDEAVRRSKARDARRRDLEHALSEIDKAAPRPGEDEDLLAERRIVGHAEKLKSLSEDVFRTLYDEEDAALSRLTTAFKRVEELARIDPRWEPYLKEREGTLGQIQDMSLFSRDYAHNIDVTPGRLDDIESRLSILERLKKKYGGSLDAVVEHRELARIEISELESSEERIEALARDLAAAKSRYLSLARGLSRERHKAARRLEKMVSKELPSLALEKARFQLDVRTDEHEERESGIDTVELLFTANPGEEPRTLAKTASGGELSRFVLALKAVSAKGERAKTLVFDEIDSGIGGRVADAVGEKLRELSSIHQVICVTHLPQIASFAPAHFRIDKMDNCGRTETRIARLTPEDRVDEIARMLAGAVVTESAREHARQLVRDKTPSSR